MAGFRLASLQIQSLCDQQQRKTEENVVHALARLSAELNLSYDAIFKQILNSQDPNPHVAERRMKWLICAQRPLKTTEFIVTVFLDSEGHCSTLCKIDILSICYNMVVLDLEQD